MSLGDEGKARRSRWAAVRGFLKTIPGMLTATATILTAVAGILAGLSQLGVLQMRSPIVVGPTTTIGQIVTTTNAGSAADSVTASTVTGEDGQTVTTYLSEAEMVLNNVTGAGEGPAKVNGVEYSHSLWGLQGARNVNAREYDLSRSYETFGTVVGVRDDSSTTLRVKFEVFADGVLLKAVTMPFGRSAELSLPVQNVLRLRLVSTTLSEGYGDAVWGDARLLGRADKVPTTT